VGKKVIVSFSLDEDILKQFDEYLRRRWIVEAGQGAKVSSRSSVLEEILLKHLSKENV
jgi:metal-responsive CopG/Arc/MetJ family transcriptional regulator